jgi:flagellar biosynthesis protein
MLDCKIIKNKKRGGDLRMTKKKVAALKYDIEKDNAPKVVAAGSGTIGEKIIEIAKENNIPLYSDKQLVEQLIKLELGSTIPPNLYQVVAEILVYIYSLEEEVKK